MGLLERYKGTSSPPFHRPVGCCGSQDTTGRQATVKPSDLPRNLPLISHFFFAILRACVGDYASGMPITSALGVFACCAEPQIRRTSHHDVVTVIGSLVPITSMKASSLSFSIAPRPAFIEVETTVGPARARGRPRMRAVPYSDLCVSSRRSRGYEKPKRAFTGPLGSTQHRELRPAHRKRPSHRETKRASNGM